MALWQLMHLGTRYYIYIYIYNIYIYIYIDVDVSTILYIENLIASYIFFFIIPILFKFIVFVPPKYNILPEKQNSLHLSVGNSEQKNLFTDHQTAITIQLFVARKEVFSDLFIS